MTAIPPEIVADILSRMAVKDLIRFRCVSKQWRRLIDSHHFIYSIHWYRSQQSISNFCSMMLIFTNRRNHLSIPLPIVLNNRTDSSANYNNSNISDYKFEESFAGDSRILGSCNGLLLLRNYRIVGRELGICNLATREYRDLPTSNRYDSYLERYFLIDEYGFAYDSVNDDYKVVRINQFLGLPLEFHNKVEIYSLKLNMWRHIECDLPFAIEYRRFGAVFSCGALHWVGKQMLDPKPLHRVILGFDVGTEEFRLIPQPDYPYEIQSIRVEGLSGRLCLSFCGVDCTDIWVMKDYGVKESWIKLLSLKLNPRCPLYRPLAYSRSGSEILLNQDGGELVVYDLAKDSLKRLKVYDLPASFDFEICVESLVRLCDYGGAAKKSCGLGNEGMNPNR